METGVSELRFLRIQVMLMPDDRGAPMRVARNYSPATSDAISVNNEPCLAVYRLMFRHSRVAFVVTNATILNTDNSPEGRSRWTSVSLFLCKRVFPTPDFRTFRGFSK